MIACLSLQFFQKYYVYDNFLKHNFCNKLISNFKFESIDQQIRLAVSQRRPCFDLGSVFKLILKYNHQKLSYQSYYILFDMLVCVLLLTSID